MPWARCPWTASALWRDAARWPPGRSGRRTPPGSSCSARPCHGTPACQVPDLYTDTPNIAGKRQLAAERRAIGCGDPSSCTHRACMRNGVRSDHMQQQQPDPLLAVSSGRLGWCAPCSAKSCHERCRATCVSMQVGKGAPRGPAQSRAWTLRCLPPTTAHLCNQQGVHGSLQGRHPAHERPGAQILAGQLLRWRQLFSEPHLQLWELLLQRPHPRCE